jgi:hypothetical protein
METRVKEFSISDRSWSPHRLGPLFVEQHHSPSPDGVDYVSEATTVAIFFLPGLSGFGPAAWEPALPVWGFGRMSHFFSPVATVTIASELTFGRSFSAKNRSTSSQRSPLKLSNGRIGTGTAKKEARIS